MVIDWEDTVKKLSCLPKLTYLFLHENNISQFGSEPLSGDEIEQLLPNCRIHY